MKPKKRKRKQLRRERRQIGTWKEDEVSEEGLRRRWKDLKGRKGERGERITKKNQGSMRVILGQT